MDNSNAEELEPLSNTTNDLDNKKRSKMVTFLLFQDTEIMAMPTDVQIEICLGVKPQLVDRHSNLDFYRVMHDSLNVSRLQLNAAGEFEDQLVVKGIYKIPFKPVDISSAYLNFLPALLAGICLNKDIVQELSDLLHRFEVSQFARRHAVHWYEMVQGIAEDFEERGMIDDTVTNCNLADVSKVTDQYAVSALMNYQSQIRNLFSRQDWSNFVNIHA